MDREPFGVAKLSSEDLIPGSGTVLGSKLAKTCVCLIQLSETVTLVFPGEGY